MSAAADAATAPQLDLDQGRVAIVGGGLATVRLCAVLRRKKFRGTITVVSAEKAAPYDRPPLSKEVLSGARDEAPLPFDVEKLDIDLRSGTRATGLDQEGRTLLTDAGPIPYDALAIATGAAPMHLPGDGPQLTLRTIEDALELRTHLKPGARVLVAGASWIGAEVATAALAADCQVTCVEYGPEPFANALGAEVGAALRPWWSDVDLRTDARIAEVVSDGVRLADGEHLPADVVVTGIGVRPDLAWLSGSGIETDRGILTDARCRTSLPGVVALGDVAQRWSKHTGEHRLIGHWDEASMVASAAAASLLDWSEGAEHDPVPYFWSDLFGHKLQYVGTHASDDILSLAHDPDGDLTGATWTRDGILTAWLGIDQPQAVVKARMAVGSPLAAAE